ncbi:hypothetical protein PanWU01x14_284140 [Parasponia andersonii]|uniref:Uncharacterized protein n=1 Tax=Parasponia andersonii TaxID=3476 RepID=A0A2P5AZX1_PARAD|nr:hypothetical protein PanWU01x14_284140 [Parasponia andersonii]
MALSPSILSAYGAAYICSFPSSEDQCVSYAVDSFLLKDRLNNSSSIEQFSPQQIHRSCRLFLYSIMVELKVESKNKIRKNINDRKLSSEAKKRRVEYRVKMKDGISTPAPSQIFCSRSSILQLDSPELGLNGDSAVTALASHALGFCLTRSKVLPFRVTPAASFRYSLRACGEA